VGVNQHSNPATDSEWSCYQNKDDVKAFQAAIVTSSLGTIVVLDMDKCPAHNRLWCLYEFDW